METLTNYKGKNKMPKKKFLTFALKRKIRIGIYIALIVALPVISWVLFDVISRWGYEHEIVYANPVEVTFNQPITIKPREKVYVINHTTYELTPEFYKGLTEVEKEICNEFGIHCKEAIAIAKAESGLRESVFGINTNNTIDVGLFQINSVHYSKQGCSLSEVSTVKGNIKCAKQIYDASGWNAWVAYQTGAYLKFLK